VDETPHAVDRQLAKESLIFQYVYRQKPVDVPTPDSPSSPTVVAEQEGDDDSTEVDAAEPASPSVSKKKKKSKGKSSSKKASKLAQRLAKSTKNREAALSAMRNSFAVGQMDQTVEDEAARVEAAMMKRRSERERVKRAALQKSAKSELERAKKRAQFVETAEEGGVALEKGKGKTSKGKKGTSKKGKKGRSASASRSKAASKRSKSRSKLTTEPTAASTASSSLGYSGAFDGLLSSELPVSEVLATRTAGPALVDHDATVLEALATLLGSAATTVAGLPLSAGGKVRAAVTLDAVMLAIISHFPATDLRVRNDGRLAPGDAFAMSLDLGNASLKGQAAAAIRSADTLILAADAPVARKTLDLLLEAGPGAAHLVRGPSKTSSFAALTAEDVLCRALASDTAAVTSLLASPVDSLPLYDEEDLVLVGPLTPTIDVLNIMRLRSVTEAAVVHEGTVVGAFSFASIVGLSTKSAAALALPVMDYVLTSEAEREKVLPPGAHSFTEHAVLCSIGAPDVKWRRAFQLFRSSMTVAQMVAWVHAEAKLPGAAAEYAAQSWPSKIYLNSSATLLFYSLGPSDEVRIVRATDPSKNDPAAFVVPTRAPPSPVVVAKGATVRQAAAHLCAAYEGGSGSLPGHCVWVVSDEASRRVLGRLTATSLVRFGLQGDTGAADMLPELPDEDDMYTEAPTPGVAAAAGQEQADGEGEGEGETAGGDGGSEEDGGKFVPKTAADDVIMNKRESGLQRMESEVNARRRGTLVRRLTSARRFAGTGGFSVRSEDRAPIFRLDPASVAVREGRGIPSFVVRACDYLTEKGLATPALFSSSSTTKNDPTVAALRQAVERGRLTAKLTTLPSINLTPHVVARVLRGYLESLPSPLCAGASYDEILKISSAKRQSFIRDSLQCSLQTGPVVYQALCKRVLLLLHAVVSTGAPGNTTRDVASSLGAALVRPEAGSEEAAETGGLRPAQLDTLLEMLIADAPTLTAEMPEEADVVEELGIERIFDEDEVGVGGGASGGEVVADGGETSRPADSTDKMVWDMRNVMHSGWLFKRGQALKRWQRRFFVIKSHFLFYWRATDAPEPDGVINLDSDAYLNFVPEKPQCFNIVVPSQNKMVRLMAASASDAVEWVDAIEVVIDGMKATRLRLQEATGGR
jgi:hypothetical protein